MRVVFVLYDSHNRLTLGCHGGLVVKTSNFDRLCERSVTFDTHDVGSLPCIPARSAMRGHRASAATNPGRRFAPPKVGSNCSVASPEHLCRSLTSHIGMRSAPSHGVK
jgi:hypothetical protein